MHTRSILAALAGVLAVLPARSCGPDFPEAIFVRHYDPDGPYAKYAAGHLGVLQSEYRTRHLMLAYDWLSGRALTPEEQKQAIAADAVFTKDKDSTTTVPASDAVDDPADDWFRLRAGFKALPADVPASGSPSMHPSPGDPYSSYDNCLDDAYTTAARTLRARIASYGATNPEVVDWVRGQDAVFSNCANAGATPQPAANASLWLKQDRAYQIAATEFYRASFADALAHFRSIAADNASPWSTTARYLEARTLIRQATVPNSEEARIGNDPNKSPAVSQFEINLKLARTELLAMRSEPRMASRRGAIDDLLDFVNLRLDPEHQAVVLAARLHDPHTRRFGQALVDLSWIRANRSPEAAYPLYDLHDRTPQAVASTRAHDRATHANATEIIDWMDSVGNSPVKGAPPAIARWRETHSMPWLVAAMMHTQPGDPGTPELIAAAEKVAPGDPGYATVTYHRLRLMPADSARAALLAVEPAILKDNGPSTHNLFAALDARTAPTLEAFLAQAARLPAAETSWGEEEDEVASDKPVDQPCGPGLREESMFLPEAANVLNTRLPLSVLAEAAESRTLPPHLRFQVIQATWARAILLDRPEIARRMSPLLIACRATWKPVLDAYDHAATADARHAAGLLALMRFASTEPSVRAGEPRRSGFASYDMYRQNWWCSTVPPLDGTVDFGSDWERRDAGKKAPPDVPAPPFLTAEQQTEAAQELSALRKIPNAANYFAAEALAWQKSHPRDPRTPELLGEATRVLRNSCRVDSTTALSQQLFETLHKSYPQSEWAKRYSTWE